MNILTTTKIDIRRENYRGSQQKLPLFAAKYRQIALNDRVFINTSGILHCFLAFCAVPPP